MKADLSSIPRNFMGSLKFYWGIFFIFLLIDLILSVMSWEQIRSSVGWIKEIPQTTEFKLRHIVQYSPQSIWLLICVSKTWNFDFKKSALISIFGISFVGFSSEIIQYFVPTRLFSILDIFWDMTAALVGVLMYWLFLKIKENA